MVLRADLRTQPDNLELAHRLWRLLSGETGFDVRTGQLLVETFRASALRTDAGVAALVSAFRRLADETGESPRAALVDPVLESRLRLFARTSDGELSQHIQWILKCIEDEL